LRWALRAYPKNSNRCLDIAEGRRQKAEGRRQKAEGRRQKAEGRRQKAEGSKLRKSRVSTIKNVLITLAVAISV
jgi:uncharacterized protein YjbJ (UPF0337 family)